MQYLSHRHALAKPVQLTLCLLVLCLSVALLVLGSRVLLASLNEYRASRFLADWETKRQVPSEQAWQVAEDAMSNAIDWYPAANGAYAEQFGYMWQWRSYSVPATQANSKEYQQQAIVKFRTASQLRPTWPAAWSGLAYAKLVAGEWDQEFAQTMQHAAKFGPSRIGINRRLAEIGLIAWPQLTPELQALTLEQAKRTVGYSAASRAELFKLATEVQRSELLCQYLQDGLKPCASSPDAGSAPLNSTSTKHN